MSSINDTCSVDRRVGLLEELQRVRAVEIARQMTTWGRDTDIEVDIEFGDPNDGGPHRHRVRLSSYRVGFGRHPVLTCPACGHRCQALCALDAGARLACVGCTGRPRYAARHGHKAWYRRVVRHTMRQAKLLEWAARPKVRWTTRALLWAEAERCRAAAAGWVSTLRRDG
jgi:hypothetical protein